MFQVGDTVTHAAYLAALGTSHGYEGRVQAWYDGDLQAEVEFETGSVKVTARNRERRSLDLTVAEKLWPALPTDALSPYGVWLRGYATVISGATRFPEIPVFTGKLLKVARQRWSGQLTVSAVDPMWQINREAFEAPRPAPTGTLNTAAIRMLILEVFPEASVTDLTGATDAIPSATAWDAGSGSRGKAVDELAAAIGAEVIAVPGPVWPGGTFVIRPVPSLADATVWTLPDGAASIVADDQLSQSGAGVVNRCIVQVERTDLPALYVPVTDQDAASPTRYGGPMGRLPDFYSSQLITSEAQGLTAGRAKLSRSLGLARTRQVTIMANPALEGGDVLAIGVDSENPERHIVDDFAIGLTADPAEMTIATRSTGEDL